MSRVSCFGRVVPSIAVPSVAARILVACAASACLVSTAFAHGPTPKKIDETIAIAAPPDVVWKKLGDFGGISTWHPDVSASQADKGNAVGSVRTLTLKGGKLTESMDEYDTANRSYSYRMEQENVDALPVSSYSATIAVKLAGQGSEVSWSGRFYRGDTNNEPPENLNDEAAIKAMNAFFKNGLTGLKNQAEGRGK